MAVGPASIRVAVKVRVLDMVAALIVESTLQEQTAASLSHRTGMQVEQLEPPTTKVVVTQVFPPPITPPPSPHTPPPRQLPPEPPPLSSPPPQCLMFSGCPFGLAPPIPGVMAVTILCLALCCSVVVAASRMRRKRRLLEHKAQRQAVAADCMQTHALGFLARREVRQLKSAREILRQERREEQRHEDERHEEEERRKEEERREEEERCEDDRQNVIENYAQAFLLTEALRLQIASSTPSPTALPRHGEALKPETRSPLQHTSPLSAHVLHHRPTITPPPPLERHHRPSTTSSPTQWVPVLPLVSSHLVAAARAPQALQMPQLQTRPQIQAPQRLVQPCALPVPAPLPPPSSATRVPLDSPFVRDRSFKSRARAELRANGARAGASHTCTSTSCPGAEPEGNGQTPMRIRRCASLEDVNGTCASLAQCASLVKLVDNEPLCSQHMVCSPGVRPANMAVPLEEALRPRLADRKASFGRKNVWGVRV